MSLSLRLTSSRPAGWGGAWGRAAWAGLLWGMLACAAVAVPRPAVSAPAPVLAAGPPVLPSAGAGEAARVIVAYRRGARIARLHPWQSGVPRQEARALLQRRADALAAHAGTALATGRAVGPQGQVLRASGLSSEALARRLAAHPDVAWVAVDGWRRAWSVPNDPYFTSGPAVDNGSGGPVVGQWYLRAPDETFRSAVNAQAAWARSTGQGVVVAVLDTGVRFDHPDLQGRLRPGHDMVLDPDVANDGDGRDNDASDPGDGITVQEANTVGGEFYGGFPRRCAEQDSTTGQYLAQASSWHGTEVAGLLAASTNNGIGVAGVAHGVQVLPVRVLGKCGGYDSDIQAGMYWAAGIDQPGLPGNTTPARVLNLSLGGIGACSTAYQQAVDAITARNVVVVAAAGNSAGHGVGTPANCRGVIAVAGLRHAGTKVGFSDLGSQIAIAAPGGNCVNIGAGEPCLYPLVTTTNLGLLGPGENSYSDSFRISVGTSFAAPLVAGAAAMILSLRPDWSPAQVREVLQTSSRPFPTTSTDPTVRVCKAPTGADQLECLCTTSLCGAGMLDVDAALAQASSAGGSAGSSGGGAFGGAWLLALAAATALMSAQQGRRRRARSA